MMRAALDTTIAVRDEVIFRSIQGEAIVLDVSTGMYFALDPVGTRMWTLLADAASIGRVVEAVCNEYDVERPRVEHDVVDLVDQLVDRELVRLQPLSGGDDRVEAGTRGDRKAYAKPRLTEYGKIATVTKSV